MYEMANDSSLRLEVARYLARTKKPRLYQRLKGSVRRGALYKSPIVGKISRIIEEKTGEKPNREQLEYVIKRIIEEEEQKIGFK